MVRPKGNVWDYFKKSTNEENQPIVICNFCPATYSFPNATRMTRHLLQQCKRCPDAVIARLKDEPPKGISEQTDKLEGDSSGKSPPPPVPASQIEKPTSNRALEVQDGPGPTQPNRPSNVEGGPGPSHAKRPRLNNTSMSSFVDTLSKDEVERIDLALGKAVIAGGLPFAIFDSNPYFAEAFQLMRPAYKSPPSAHTLRKPLLNGLFTEAKGSIIENLKKALCFTLMCDGWTNRRGEGIINVIVATPELNFFKALEPKEKRETAVYLSEELIAVTGEIGSDRALLLVADNASVMKRMGELVRLAFPHIITVGCLSHGLNLIFKDIMKGFSSLKADAVAVVKTFRLKRVNAAIFAKKQKDAYGSNSKSLAMPSKTRFAADTNVFSALEANKTAIRESALSDEADVPEAVYKTIMDNHGFWKNISHVLALLKPIARGIHVLEGDYPTLSLVPRVFMDIIQEVTSTLTNSPFSESVKTAILVDLQYRIKYCCKDVHKTAYLLDPRFFGDGLTDDEILDCTEVIRSLAKHLGLDEVRIINNLSEYRSKEGLFSREILWTSAKEPSCDPCQWWRGFRAKQPLRPVAERLLQLKSTSCSCERIWSDYEFVHSKRRNRLLNDKVLKQVTVRKYLRTAKSNAKNQKTAAPNKLLDNIKYYMNVKAVPLYLGVDCDAEADRETDCDLGDDENDSDFEPCDDECSDESYSSHDSD